jgi:hypothetical protein
MKNFIRWLKEKFKNLWNAFFYKDGKLSKTSIFLSLFSLTLLAMWIFQGLFVGVTLLGWWLVPEFNIGAAVAVMSIFSALYIVNRSKVVDRSIQRAELAEMASARRTADKVAEAISGHEVNDDEEEDK